MIMIKNIYNTTEKPNELCTFALDKRIKSMDSYNHSVSESTCLLERRDTNELFKDRGSIPEFFPTNIRVVYFSVFDQFQWRFPTKGYFYA